MFELEFRNNWIDTGDFVVTWRGPDVNDGGPLIWYCLFDSTGNALGPEQQMPTVTGNKVQAVPASSSPCSGIMFRSSVARSRRLAYSCVNILLREARRSLSSSTARPVVAASRLNWPRTRLETW